MVIKMDKSLGLDKSELDAIKEVGNMGVGNAATALSKMLNKKVEIRLNDTKFIPIEDFANEMGGAERIVVTSYMQITSDMKGEALFLFSRESALQMVDLVMERDVGTTKIIDSMEESAFKEMSNIFTGSYLNSMSKMFEMKLIHSVPHIAVDMTQAVIDFVLIRLATKAEKVLTIHTTIDIEDHDINGIFIILFEESSLKKMVDILHNKYGIGFNES